MKCRVPSVALLLIAAGVSAYVSIDLAVAQQPGGAGTQSDRGSRAKARELTRDANILFQFSTLDALTQGIYEGALTFDELARRGSFGLGTFDSLDGEMVALNGTFYQIRSDGTVWRVAPNATTPFAAVTEFRPEARIEIHTSMTMSEVSAFLDRQLPSLNYFYAVKIHGRFQEVLARSVPKQVPPFPPLGNVVAQQSRFPLRHSEGTLVGFRTPQFEAGINAAGYHFHYIADDERAGGHALDFEIADAVIEISMLREHTTLLPATESFGAATLPIE